MGLWDNIVDFIRKIIYFHFALISLNKVLFKRKIILLDLDHTLCDNNLLKKDVNQKNKPDYKFDIPINKKVLKELSRYNNYNIVILTARGFKSINFTKRWLNKNNFEKEKVFFAGDPWMKLIPIILCIFIRKEIVLIDDLTYDGVKPHPIKSIILRYFKNENFKYIDSLDI